MHALLRTFLWILVVVPLSLCGSAVGSAEDENPTQGEAPVEAENQEEGQEVESSPVEEVVENEDEVDSVEGSEGDEIDPCRLEGVDGTLFVDRLNRGMYRTVCGTSMWFDGFFGDNRSYDESQSTFGHVNFGNLWTTRDGYELRVRSRIHVELPNLQRKAYGFIGRVAPSEYLTDSAENASQNRFLSGDEDLEWLMGFGYTPLNRGAKRFSVSAGVHVSWPLDPYVKAQYRWYKLLSERRLFRWRQTLFWTYEEGWGTTTGLDLEWRFSEDILTRFTNTARISEVSVGVEWWSAINIFHGWNERDAFGYRVWAKGETDSPESLREYGVGVIYRRRLHREWLYGELGTGLFWPKEPDEPTRDTHTGVWFAIEVQFGEHRFDPDKG